MEADLGRNCWYVAQGIWRGSRINGFNYARWGKTQDLLVVFIIERRLDLFLKEARIGWWCRQSQAGFQWPDVTLLFSESPLCSLILISTRKPHQF